MSILIFCVTVAREPMSTDMGTCMRSGIVTLIFTAWRRALASRPVSLRRSHAQESEGGNIQGVRASYKRSRLKNSVSRRVVIVRRRVDADFPGVPVGHWGERRYSRATTYRGSLVRVGYAVHRRRLRHEALFIGG